MPGERQWSRRAAGEQRWSRRARVEQQWSRRAAVEQESAGGGEWWRRRAAGERGGGMHHTVSIHKSNQRCQGRVWEKFIFQGQGKVREFCKKSGKIFGYGKVREFCDECPQYFFSCDEAALRPLIFRLSICHTFLTMFRSSYHPEIFRSYYHWQTWCPCKRSKVKVTEVMTPFNHNSSLNSHMAMKWCMKLDVA